MVFSVKIRKKLARYPALEVRRAIHTTSPSVLRRLHGISPPFSRLLRRVSDGGDNWSIIDGGTTETISSVHFAGDRIGWAVGLNGLILKTVTGGE